MRHDPRLSQGNKVRWSLCGAACPQRALQKHHGILLISSSVMTDAVWLRDSKKGWVYWVSRLGPLGAKCVLFQV